MPHYTTKPVSIAHGEALSDAVDLRGWTLAAIFMPAGWTTANIGLQASVDDTDYAPVYNTAGDLFEYSSPVAGSCLINEAEQHALPFVKLWSESSGEGVDQTPGAGLTRDFVLFLKNAN